MKAASNVAKNISYVPEPVPLLQEHQDAYLINELNKIRDTVDRINEAILLIRTNLNI